MPTFRAAPLLLAATLLAGCASLPNRDPPRVDVVGIEPLAGEGLELRMAVKLRVQNPNDTPIRYEGAALELAVNGRTLASGVSAAGGSVPRYGESVVVIPVSVSALNMARQIGPLLDQRGPALEYTVRGKLEGGLFGTRRFSGSGRFDSELLGPARLR